MSWCVPRRLQERHAGDGQPRRLPLRPPQGRARPRRRGGLPGAALGAAHALHQHHVHRLAAAGESTPSALSGRVPAFSTDSTVYTL